MGCGDKRKHTCGKKVNSVCVKYEGTIPENSDLFGEDCVVVEEVLEDLYTQVGDISEGLDLSELGSCGIDYSPEDPTDLQVNEVLVKHEDLLCGLKNFVDNTTSVSFDINNIDTKCLEDPCGGTISNLEALLQAMIDKLCECCEDGRIDPTNGGTPR